MEDRQEAGQGRMGVDSPVLEPDVVTAADITALSRVNIQGDNR